MPGLLSGGMAAAEVPELQVSPYEPLPSSSAPTGGGGNPLLNARMRLQSIRQSYADGLVGAQAGAGGPDSERGGGVETVVPPGQVVTPTTSLGEELHLLRPPPEPPSSSQPTSARSRQLLTAGRYAQASPGR